MREYINNQVHREPVAPATNREHFPRKPSKEPPPPPLPPLPSQSASPTSLSSLGHPYRYSSISSATRSCCSLSHQAYHEGSEYAGSEISIPHSARSLQPHPIFLANSKFVDNLPPRPAQRTPRPRLSVSPIPELKKAQEQLETCTSLNYRRHIEQHVERVFKYLSGRKGRLEECEAELSVGGTQGAERDTIYTLLAKKETRYLRSLRYRMSTADFEQLNHLGRGVIGSVSLVQYKPFGSSEPKLYAMKKLKKSQVIDQNHIAHIKAERDILAEADNDWIVKLFYSFQDSGHLYFILEYIPGGDLMGLIMNQNVLSQEWAKFYIAEISLAVQFVHDLGFIHRDIKPDNILIDARGHIKLTDFGLSTGFRWTHDSRYYQDETLGSSSLSQSGGNNDDHPTITRELTQREMEHSVRRRNLSIVGSPNYMAPEVLDQARYRYLKTDDIHANERLCDWWSVGVILYEMVVGYCPFIDLNLVKKGIWDARLESNANIQWRILGWRNFLTFPSQDPNSPPLSMNFITKQYYQIRPETKHLIKGLLCDPEDRLCQNGIKDIRDHPFFRGIDWQNIRSGKPPYVPKLSGDRDTSYFECPDPQTSDPENSIGGNAPRMFHMNDWTFKNFFSASRSARRSSVIVSQPR